MLNDYINICNRKSKFISQIKYDDSVDKLNNTNTIYIFLKKKLYTKFELFDIYISTQITNHTSSMSSSITIILSHIFKNLKVWSHLNLIMYSLNIIMNVKKAEKKEKKERGKKKKENGKICQQYP